MVEREAFVSWDILQREASYFVQNRDCMTVGNCIDNEPRIVGSSHRNYLRS